LQKFQQLFLFIFSSCDCGGVHGELHVGMENVAAIMGRDNSKLWNPSSKLLLIFFYESTGTISPTKNFFCLTIFILRNSGNMMYVVALLIRAHIYLFRFDSFFCETPHV